MSVFHRFFLQIPTNLSPLYYPPIFVNKSSIHAGFRVFCIKKEPPDYLKIQHLTIVKSLYQVSFSSVAPVTGVKWFFYSCTPLVLRDWRLCSFNIAFSLSTLPGRSLNAIMIRTSRSSLAYNSAIPYFLSALCVS